LAMHSGIPDYLNASPSLIPKIAADPQKAWPADALIKAGIGLGLTPPGPKGSYSSTNYILLQDIAEEVSGSTLQQLVAAAVTGPLGMKDTALPPNDDTTLPEPALQSLLTPSCRKELASSGAKGVPVGTDLTHWNASYGQGAGGMSSTLGDMAVWAASGTGDALLSQDLVTARNTMTRLTDLPAYGLGLTGFKSWVGHAGEALGWETLVLKNTETGVVVVVAANSCGTGVLLGFSEIFRTLFQDQPLF
jgi:D-alanyl-D-alanine carboxypeptidase